MLTKQDCLYKGEGPAETREVEGRLAWLERRIGSLVGHRLIKEYIMTLLVNQPDPVISLDIDISLNLSSPIIAYHRLSSPFTAFHRLSSPFIAFNRLWILIRHIWTYLDLA